MRASLRASLSSPRCVDALLVSAPGGGSPEHDRGRGDADQRQLDPARPVAERLVTIAKQGDLHARRRIQTVIRNKDVVHVLMTEIGPRFENREGGYTRIVKVGPRKGDNAPMAIIELVEALDAARAAEAIAKRAAKEQARAEAAAAAAVVTEETVVEESASDEVEAEVSDEVEAIEAEAAGDESADEATTEEA